MNVPVTVKGDTLFEGDQTFNLNVTLAAGQTGVAIADGQGAGTIVDDDPMPTLTINNPAAVQEPAGTNSNSNTSSVVFTITLTGAHEQTSSVVWSTANGTATGGLLGGLLFPNTDYRTSTNSAGFAGSTGATQTASATVAVFHNPDTTATETFFVNLGNLFGVAVAPTNAAIGTGQGVGTITNR